MIKYYQKRFPKVKITLADGSTFKFDALPGDRDLGVLATGNESLIKEFDGLIREHVGGLTELTKVEYETLLEQKKSLPSVPVSRQEFRPGTRLAPDTLAPPPPVPQSGEAAVPVKPPAPVPTFTRPAATKVP